MRHMISKYWTSTREHTATWDNKSSGGLAVGVNAVHLGDVAPVGAQHLVEGQVPEGGDLGGHVHHVPRHGEAVPVGRALASLPGQEVTWAASRPTSAS